MVRRVRRLSISRGGFVASDRRRCVSSTSSRESMYREENGEPIYPGHLPLLGVYRWRHQRWGWEALVVYLINLRRQGSRVILPSRVRTSPPLTGDTYAGGGSVYNSADPLATW